MELLPFGVVFAGYTVAYYGMALLRGPGMGFLDLLVPSHWSKADQVFTSYKQIKNPAGLEPR